MVVLLAWAGLVAVVSLVAIYRRSRLKSPPPGEARPVLLVRPCAGAEAGLEAHLTSIRAAQRPPGPLTLGFSVADPSDAARPILERAAALAGASVQVVDPGDAPNRKAAQLAAWLPQTPPDGVLVCVDSDVDLTDFPLDSLIAPLDDAAVGATWAAPAEHGGTTAGDRASAAFLGASLHAFALLGPLDPQGLVGKVFAVRAEALRLSGGMAGFEHTLGEDMALAERLRFGGYRVVMVPAPARAFPQGRTRAAVVGRFARWFAVIRAQRPALLVAYPLLFGATTPLVLLGSILGAWSVVALALGTRLVVAHAARRFSRLPSNPLILLRDLVEGEWVTWAAFLRTLRTREVEWRGRRLRIEAGGRLRAVA